MSRKDPYGDEMAARQTARTVTFGADRVSPKDLKRIEDQSARERRSARMGIRRKIRSNRAKRRSMAGGKR